MLEARADVRVPSTRYEKQKSWDVTSQGVIATRRETQQSAVSDRRKTEACDSTVENMKHPEAAALAKSDQVISSAIARKLGFLTDRGGR